MDKKYMKHDKNSIFAGMKVKLDTSKVFGNAIKKGMKNPDDWMYMYSSRRKDYFKHIITRNYCSYSQHGLF